MATHEFKCPGCGLSCLLRQEQNGKAVQASIQHQLPTCNVYDRTKSDGQKFLELAYQARPEAASFQLVRSGPEESKKQ